MALSKPNSLPVNFRLEPDNLNTKYTADQIKDLLQDNPEYIIAYLDGLIDKLNSTTNDDSGADNIAATNILGLTGNTVQAILEALKTYVDTNDTTIQQNLDDYETLLASVSGASTVGGAVTGLAGSTVQALLTALKQYIDTHKDSADHDGRYFTESELTGGALDGRYYTETESDAKYTTKDEITTNRKLSATGDFTGTLNGLKITQVEPALSSLVEVLKGEGNAEEKVNLSAFNVHLADYEKQNKRTTHISKFPIISPEVDDTARLQRSLDGLEDGSTFVLNEDCLISNTVTCAKNNILFISRGWADNPKIYTTTPNITLLHIKGYRCIFEGVSIIGDGENGGEGATTVGLLIENEANYDLDSIFDKAHFKNHAVCVKVRSRNVSFTNRTTFSNSLKGIQVLAPLVADLEGYRGLEVKDCRFHSIGGFSRVGTTKRICIEIDPTINYTEVKANDNYIDDCDEFLVGGFNTGEVVNNKSTRSYGSLMRFYMTGGTLPSVERALLVVGNSLRFQNTNNASHGIEINGKKVIIGNNRIQRSQYHGIYANVLTYSTLNDNEVSECGYDASATYDGIHLSASSVYNQVKDNYVIKEDANCKTRYGIYCGDNNNNFNGNQSYDPNGVMVDFFVTDGKTAFGDTVCKRQKPRVETGTAAPTTGKWTAGDIVYNSSPTAGGKVGWICITAGTPGVWKPFGAIDA